MVLICAELESDLFWKWFSRPRQTDGSTVEDYYALFCQWKEEMISLSFPAKEEDYIDGFMDNLRWEIQFRLSGYTSSMSRLIDVYYDAKFEESMLVIEETLKHIKATLDLDPNEPQMHDSNKSTEAIVQLVDDSHNFVMSNGVECNMESTTNESTEPNLAGLNLFSANYHFNSRIEEVELLHKAEKLGNEKFQQSYSFKNEVTDVVYQVFDEMPDPGQTALNSFSLLSSFGHEETDDSPPIQVYNQSVYNKLDDNGWLNKIMLLIFDPGGCSRLHMGCGSFKCCNEPGDYCWVANVAERVIISDPLTTHQEACNEWSELHVLAVLKVDAFIYANPMTGISAVSTCAIRFEGETYVITRATSEKNVMVDDAFDRMTKSTQLDVTRVHRGMISSHNNHSSFLVENEWCLTDLSSHSKNNFVYSKCENLYSLNEMLVLVFDPGGCSFLCMDCRLLEYNEEHRDLQFTTNAVDAPEIFYYAFDGDSTNQFSKGIYILGLSMGLQCMAFAWVVFEEQFCEQKHALIILRNSQQALLHNMDKCNVVVTSLPMQRVLFYFDGRALLPLAYTMHIKYTLLGSNILGYQNAAIQRITHKIFHLLDGFKHSQVLTKNFCVDELLLVDLNRDRLHTFMHAFRVETTVQQHVKFLSDGNDSSAGKVHEDFGSKIMSIGLDMSRCKEFSWVVLLSGLRCFVHYLSSIGIIVTKLQIFVWDPGRNIISIHILEDKDVVEGVGKDMVLMDTTLVIMGYDHEVQMRCLVMMNIVSCCHLQEYMNDSVIQVEQCAEGNIFLRPSTLLLTLTLSCKVGESASIIHFGVVMIDPSFIMVVENFVWDPGLIFVYFQFSTLRTRWLLRGRICHELTFYYIFYMYFRTIYLAVMMSSY